MLLFRLKLLSPCSSKSVVTRFPIVIRKAPFCFDPALGLQSVECRIKGALLDVENLFRHLLNSVRNREAMPWIMLEGFEDQHVEGAVNEVRFFFGHGAFS